jgi:putative phage-type endonuclease
MSILPVKHDPNVTEKRNIYVGGSDVPTILGINKYKTQYELAKEKVGMVQTDFKGNEYTEFGNILEPQIRDYINAVNMVQFIPGTKIDNSRNIRSNTDGYDFENNLILEIKTHGKNLNTKPYIAQMQLYMAQFGCDYGWLALYERPDNFDTEFDAARLKIEVIERDDEYVNQIFDAIETFWIRCEFLKENPEATENDFYNFGQNEVAPLVAEISRLEMELIHFKELETKYKDAKKKLHDAMEEYDIKKFETDTVVITRLLPTTRESIDSTKIKKELPDIFSKYKKVSKVAGNVRIKLKEEKII